MEETEMGGHSTPNTVASARATPADDSSNTNAGEARNVRASDASEDEMLVLPPRPPVNPANSSDKLDSSGSVTLSTVDSDVVLKAIEPLTVKRKIQEKTEALSALVTDEEEIECLCGFDQRLPEAVFVNLEDEDFFTGTTRVRAELSHPM